MEDESIGGGQVVVSFIRLNSGTSHFVFHLHQVKDPETREKHYTGRKNTSH